MNAASYITVAALAERWGISSTFIRRAIWDGRLKATRFGRSVRISIDEADRYAQIQTKERK